MATRSYAIKDLTILGSAYETIDNNFNTTISSGSTVTINVNSSVLVGALGSSITTWEFAGIDTSNGSSLTVSVIIDGNSLYGYGRSCIINGISIPSADGVKWSGGIAPVATNNDDILQFTIVTDNAGSIKVYGASALNFS